MQFCRKILPLLGSQTFFFELKHFGLYFGEEVFGGLDLGKGLGFKAVFDGEIVADRIF
jgi:hypothetical protein